MKRIGECKRCGACCRVNYAVMELDDNEVEMWRDRGARMHHLGGDDYIIVDAPCQHLQKNSDGTTYCDDYANRPDKCKVFPSAPTQLYQEIERERKCGYSFVEE